MRDYLAAGRRRTDLNSDQSQLVHGPLSLSLGAAMLTLGPRGVLLVIGSTGSDGCRVLFFFFSTEGEPLLQSSGLLTELEMLRVSGNVEGCWDVIYPTRR